MQINLNILTENNHSSLLSKNVPTADNALLQYMQKVTQGTNNADTEDKKQQKLQHIVNKLKHGKKLTAQEMEFLRMNYPDEYQHALRIQKMAEMLENQLKHAKSKQEADGYIAAAVSGIPDDDPDKECLVAAFNEISKEFQIFPVGVPGQHVGHCRHQQQVHRHVPHPFIENLHFTPLTTSRAFPFRSMFFLIFQNNFRPAPA